MIGRCEACGAPDHATPACTKPKRGEWVVHGVGKGAEKGKGKGKGKGKEYRVAALEVPEQPVPGTVPAPAVVTAEEVAEYLQTLRTGEPVRQKAVRIRPMPGAPRVVCAEGWEKHPSMFRSCASSWGCFGIRRS